MYTIVDLRTPAGAFVLEETFEAIPTLQVEFARTVCTGQGCLVPFAWFGTDDADRIDDALRADSTVGSHEQVGDCGDERLYRIRWAPDAAEFAHELTDADATVWSATGYDGWWSAAVVFPERAALSRIVDEWNTENGGITVDSVRQVSSERLNSFGRTHGLRGLSEPQREVLVAAYEAGYFDIPRQVTMSDLAETLDVSQQALSERLRRAHSQLVQREVVGPAADRSERSRTNGRR